MKLRFMVWRSGDRCTSDCKLVGYLLYCSPFVAGVGVGKE